MSVKHLHAFDDLPVVIATERRHTPDRRGTWRGGRRSTDWTERPIGAWRHLEQQFSGWRRWSGMFRVSARLHAR